MVLSQEEITSIEQKAKDILASTYGKEEISPPIDLSKITDEYGFDVKIGDFDDEDVAGQYDKSKKEIAVSKKDIYQRQVFTVAHELGHFFLHDDKDVEIFYRKNFMQLDTEQEKQEAEANWFAASLLMPEDSVKKYWKVTNDIDDFTKIFGVSYSAVHFRLKNLKLIQ